MILEILWMHAALISAGNSTVAALSAEQQHEYQRQRQQFRALGAVHGCTAHRPEHHS